MDPLVTIGIPTFNRADTLSRSIEQALSQTYTNIEIIIYDDGSSDDTHKVLSKFSSHKKIKIFSRENKGPPYPLNFIISESKGEFIVFFHDHDIFESNLVEQCINAFKRFDTASFVLFNDFDSYDLTKHSPPIELFDGKQDLLKELNNKKSFASKFHACSMVKKNVYKELGSYKTHFGFYSDVDFWHRALLNGNYAFVSLPLITFTKREDDHLLSNREIQVINSLFEIYSSTVNLIYPNMNYLKKIKQKYFHELLKIILSIISSRPERNYVNLINYDYLPTFFHFLFIRFLVSKPISIILRPILFSVKNFLKRNNV